MTPTTETAKAPKKPTALQARKAKVRAARPAPMVQKAKPQPPPKKATKPRASRAKAERKPTKIGTVVGLLRRPEGATLAVLMKATNWQENSMVWFINGTLKKKGLTVTKVAAEGKATTYHLPLEEAV